jgi:hypothetical protein
MFEGVMDFDAMMTQWLMGPSVLNDLPLMMRQADQAIAAARVATDLPTFAGLAPDYNGRREAGDFPALHPIARAFAPNFEYEVRAHFQSATERRLAATALALRCYAAGHGGALPATLDELVPAYLPAVPADPMAVGRRLTYRPAGDDPLLYGVGADGRDDDASEESEYPGGGVCDDWRRLSGTRDVVVHLRGMKAGTWTR